MVAAFKEYVIDFQDVKLSIVCKKCNAEMIIDLSTKNSLKLFERCAACRSEVDDNFKLALYDFQSAYLTFSNEKKDRPAVARIRVQSKFDGDRQ